MIRLLHLSDLHFGRNHPELVAPLLQSVARLAPDLVVISGDFTQRARAGQFQQARAFLSNLAAPWLAVPGNHDIPLDRPLVRFLRPFAGYRGAICHDLEPVYTLPGLTVLGFNTAAPRHVQAGHIRRGRFAALLARVRAAQAAGQQVAVVAHHPFSQPDDCDKAPIDGAPEALAAMARAGVGLLLTGHLHRWRIVPFEGGSSLLQLQVGTGLSTRERGEPNDFGLIDLSAERVSIARHLPDPSGRSVMVEQVGFARCGGGWVAEATPARTRKVGCGA